MKQPGLMTNGYQHQLVGLEKSLLAEYYGLLMEQGTGKSWVVLARAFLMFPVKIDALVVIAPKGTYRNWAREFKLHWPGGAESVYIGTWSSYLLAEEKRKLDRCLEAPKPKDKLKVLLMNVEALSTKEPKGKKRSSDSKRTAIEYLKSFMLANRSLLVVDESTTIKSKGSTRTKQLIDARSLAPYRMILSGHPVPKAPTDLFSQCLFLKRGAISYTSMLAFEAQFVVKKRVVYGPRSFEKVVGYQRLDELQALIEPFTYRVTKSQCLDLPPKIYQTRDVELTPEQKRLYNGLADEMRAEIGGVVTTALHAMTRIIKLHQLSAGFLSGDKPDSVTVDVPSNRMTQLLEALEELHGQTIVWANYRHSLVAIERDLTAAGYRVVSYWGATSAEGRESAITRFQNGDADVFLGNPMVGGMGITLTNASNVVYFSNSYNLEHRIQSEDRCHRIGQTRAVTYIDLVARGTVDERIVEVLKSKKQTGGLLLGDDPKEWNTWLQNV